MTQWLVVRKSDNVITGSGTASKAPSPPVDNDTVWHRACTKQELADLKALQRQERDNGLRPVVMWRASPIPRLYVPADDRPQFSVSVDKTIATADGVDVINCSIQSLDNPVFEGLLYVPIGESIVELDFDDTGLATFEARTINSQQILFESTDDYKLSAAVTLTFVVR